MRFLWKEGKKYREIYAYISFNLTFQNCFQIWLKDAVQCLACQMSVHKKCINKCQNSTVCGSASDTSTITSYASTPEFKVTEAADASEQQAQGSTDDLLDTKSLPNEGGHRASLGDFLAQGLKRVNSANNLAIPAIVASLSNQSTKSLPPSPQLTPR